MKTIGKGLGLGLGLGLGVANAGGLSRPNGIDARAVGFGGAFDALADDASAVYFQPAALAWIDPEVSIGGELVVGPRSYTPNGGAPQDTTIVAPLPTGGVVARLYDRDRPSRLTFGIGAWNTFGGKVSFAKTGMPALDASEDAAFEVDAGAALRISDRLAIGATLRLGIGIFALDATQMPFDAHLSASGLGVALGLGAVVVPRDDVRVGLAYRSPLRIATTGDGAVGLPAGTTQEQIEHDQTWPQQASLGVGWLANARWRLAVQLDWTEWSQIHELAVSFPASPGLDQIYPEHWHDSIAVRVGGEYRASRALALRGGAYVDTNAVPDRSIERQYLDSDKLGVALGASAHAGGWRVDSAVDVVLPTTRDVPDNTAATVAFPADTNKAPGRYTGMLVTVELAVARSF